MADRSSLQPSTLELLRKRVKTAPDGPGVYRWLNKDGTILYVGKAKNLRKRLASYVAPAKGNVGPWKQSFLLQIADFDVTVTNTELEALILETNLIKELKPKYNVLMKDDKNYVYIRISKDTFPRIDVVRKIFHDGAKYFGPKTTAEEARQVLTMLRKIYPFRTCKMEIEVVTRGTGEAGGTGDSDDEPRRDDLPRRLNDNQNENPPLETQGPESIIVKDPGVQYEKPETATSVEGGNT
ncbi:MAG: excinuclease subunit, partial [Candidatus Peribacteria bacterium]|nr:excinuclease subunit [Candidatus Peribacteria bacterium]